VQLKEVGLYLGTLLRRDMHHQTYMEWSMSTTQLAVLFKTYIYEIKIQSNFDTRDSLGRKSMSGRFSVRCGTSHNINI
jgi:hypothetical protein